MNASMIAYEAARTVFAIQSQAFTVVRDAYRARTVGDAEFLAARKAFEIATNTVNAAQDAVVEDEIVETVDDAQQ